ncbi:hypothetical protein SGLAM104S_03753 [Streptomyces glaucescens]
MSVRAKSAVACASVLLLALGTTSAHGLPADDPPPQELFEKAAPATVHILGEGGSGTGFVYDAGEGLILTNAHVVDGESGPVIPVAQWGCNELLPPYAKKPNLLPRKTHQVLAGPPVDLSRFYGKEMTADVLREATEVIMAAVTRQLEAIRGEKAPETPYDPRRERIEQRRRTQAQSARGAVGAAADARTAGEKRKEQTRQQAGQGGRLRHRVLGHRLRHGPRRRGLRGHPVGAPRRTRRRRQLHPHQKPDYLPGVGCPRTCGPPPTPPRPPTPGLHRPRRALADAARGPRGLDAAAGARHRPGVADEGRRTRLAMRMSEVIGDVAEVGAERIAVVTGPNLAREIAARMPAAAVVACPGAESSPSASRPPATRRTSAPTPTPTSSAANWAAP